MRISSLRGRLAWLFFAFFLLVSVSAAATFWSLDAQHQDALLVNLAGRQRMLVQQITRLALEQVQEPAAPVVLHDARAMFEQTLAALRDGGPAPYLAGQSVTVPAANQPEIRAQLDRQAESWRAFVGELDRLVQAAPGSDARVQAAQAIAQQSTAVLAQADTVVLLYQETATRKIDRLRLLQAVFLTSALLLLLLAGWLVRRWLLTPLQQLDRAAERIGGDDLATPVSVSGPAEIALLSRTLETMRTRLQTSRAELLRLAAGLEARVAQRTRELDALNEVSREISSQLDVQHVLNSVTAKAHGLLGAEVASLCLLDEQGKTLHLRTLSGPPAAASGHQVTAGDRFARMVLTADGAMACHGADCHAGCQLLAAPYRASHLAAPLRRGAHVVGALCVGSRQDDRFTAESADILAKLATTAAVALENARLYAQAERVATLEERSRIAAEMHDGLGQTLSYLGLMTDQTVEFLSQGQDAAALARLQATRATIEQATHDVRRAIDHLLDETPALPDLVARLAAVVDDFAAANPVTVDWQPAVAALPGCAREVGEQVVHVTREALHNVASHAGAQAVTVRLARDNGHYLVTVVDDGRGFDPSQPEPDGHFGLKVMQARAAHIGGQLTVESRPGRGTCVALAWPAAAEG